MAENLKTVKNFLHGVKSVVDGMENCTNAHMYLVDLPTPFYSRKSLNIDDFTSIIGTLMYNEFHTTRFLDSIVCAII